MIRHPIVSLKRICQTKWYPLGITPIRLQRECKEHAANALKESVLHNYRLKQSNKTVSKKPNWSDIATRTRVTYIATQMRVVLYSSRLSFPVLPEHNRLREKTLELALPGIIIPIGYRVCKLLTALSNTILSERILFGNWQSQGHSQQRFVLDNQNALRGTVSIQQGMAIVPFFCALLRSEALNTCQTPAQHIPSTGAIFSGG